MPEKIQNIKGDRKFLRQFTVYSICCVPVQLYNPVLLQIQIIFKNVDLRTKET